jgi:hypothetical protein
MQQQHNRDCANSLPPPAHVHLDEAPTLADLISAKHASERAFHDAIVREEAAELAYFRARPEHHLAVELAIGACLKLGIRFDLDQHRSECLREIDTVYRRDGPQAARILAKVLGEAAAIEQVDRWKAADIRTIGEAYQAAQASRDAFGYGQAIRDWQAASEADLDAFRAICAFRSATPEALRTQAEFLLEEMQKSRSLEPEHIELFLRSIILSDRKGGAA